MAVASFEAGSAGRESSEARVNWSRVVVPAASAALGAALGADYERWYGLGPGGTQHNVLGWLEVTYLRSKKRETTSVTPYRAHIGEEFDGHWLPALAARVGPRPRIASHPIPQRQQSQPGDLRARVAVGEMFDAQIKGDVCYEASHFEKRNVALTLAAPSRAHSIARSTHGEMAHIHPSDGSMHMIFSPSDACAVLEAQWGERHSLAGVTRDLPLTYILIYAPRDLDEAAVTGQLLDAAVGYMTQSSPSQVRGK